MALADSTGRYKLELTCSAEAEADVAPPGWSDSGSSDGVAGRGDAFGVNTESSRRGP